MISSDKLRNVDISAAQNGYNKNEVNALLDEAADTVDAYINQSEELYHKLEVLAAKIEEYRAEEDLIKTAIIKAEKTGEQIKNEAKSVASKTIADGEAKANAIVAKANETKAEADKINEESKLQADKIIAEARELAAKIVAEKNAEGNAIVADAEKKANEAINSSKIVAQNILDQAKEISDDLLEKSKQEKEAYELLVNALKNDAKSFLNNIKSLYAEQLEILENAKLERDDDEKQESVENVNSIHEEVESLVSEMEEIESAIPTSITIDEPAVETVDEPEVEEVIEQEPAEEIVEEAVEETVEEVVEDTVEEIEEVVEDEEPADPMEAVLAFSQNTITPIDKSTPVIPEINEEAQMDDEEESLFTDERPFENYFNVNRQDVHGDRSQVISLVPPEDDEDDDEPKFKGFFKKKK